MKDDRYLFQNIKITVFLPRMTKTLKVRTLGKLPKMGKLYCRIQQAVQAFRRIIVFLDNRFALLRYKVLHSRDIIKTTRMAA